MAALLSFDNPVFSHFAFYAGASVMKMMAMSFLTIRQRTSKKIFANEEDCKAFGEKEGDNRTKPTTSNEAVERVRRCHLNDLENIIPFVLLGSMYTLTGPDVWWALLHFRLFLGSRIMHTLAYLLPLPQPSRALMFGVGMFVNMSMGVTVLRAAAY